MQHPFLKEVTVDNTSSIVFDGPGELKIYIPTSYYPTYCQDLGTKITSIGIFVYEHLNKKYIQKLPVAIEFEFTYKDKFKGKLKDNVPPDEYDVFILTKGDAFLCNINRVQDLADVELGINKLVIEGKIPNFIPYNEVYDIILNLLEVSNMNDSLNVSSVIYEFILTELYRNRNDQYEPFRKYVNGNPNTDMYKYKLVKMTQTPALHSTFNAMTGQDAYQQILNAVLRYRNGAKDVESPVERVLKM